MSFQKLITSEFNHVDVHFLSAVMQKSVHPDDVIKDEPNTLIRQALLPCGTAAIVKTYRHRSPLNFFRQPLIRFRAQREFETLSFLSEKKVPCSRPICWGHGRDNQSGRFECLVTFEEPDVVGLKAHLRSEPADGSWIEPTARLVRQGHDVGFYHGAMVPRNILVRRNQGGGIMCIFIDTPKSIVFPKPVIDTHMAEHDLLVFLHEVNNVVGEAPISRFLAAYGIQPANIPGMVDRIVRYRTWPTTRYKIRTKFQLRKLLACVPPRFFINIR